MHIKWNIVKKRGNLRPRLTYTVVLDEYEKGLCLPMVRLTSSIPKPPQAYVPHCWPGEHERGGWVPDEFHLLSTPSYKTEELSETVTLPWRTDNVYPEVEESLTALRRAFEDMLERSSSSAPMAVSGCLETTAAAKKQIAHAFLAERILQATKG